MPIRGPKKQEKFEKSCKQLEGFDQGRHHIIVPVLDKSHYNVLDIMIDNESPNYMIKVFFYNSLVRTARRSLTRKAIPL